MLLHDDVEAVRQFLLTQNPGLASEISAALNPTGATGATSEMSERPPAAAGVPAAGETEPGVIAQNPSLASDGGAQVSTQGNSDAFDANRGPASQPEPAAASKAVAASEPVVANTATPTANHWDTSSPARPALQAETLSSASQAMHSSQPDLPWASPLDSVSQEVPAAVTVGEKALPDDQIRAPSPPASATVDAETLRFRPIWRVSSGQLSTVMPSRPQTSLDEAEKLRQHRRDLDSKVRLAPFSKFRRKKKSHCSHRPVQP